MTVRMMVRNVSTKRLYASIGEIGYSISKVSIYGNPGSQIADNVFVLCP